MTKLSLFVLALLSSASVAACSNLAAGVADSSAALASACQTAAPVLKQVQASNSSDATVQSLLGFGLSVCTVDGTVASAFSSQGDNSTPAWVGTVLSDLTMAAKVAGIVLSA